MFTLKEYKIYVFPRKMQLNIFFNPLINIKKNCPTFCKIQFKIRFINQDLERISNWCNMIFLFLNPRKCSYTGIGTPQKDARINSLGHARKSSTYKTLASTFKFLNVKPHVSEMLRSTFMRWNLLHFYGWNRSAI